MNAAPWRVISAAELDTETDLTGEHASADVSRAPQPDVGATPVVRRPWLARAMPWIVALIVLVIGVSIIDTIPVGGMHDDAMYVVLAKSLATGQGYRWLHVPGAPPATHFPPGYPALLALVWMIVPSFPANVLVFKALNAVFLAAGAAAVAVLLRRRCGIGSLAAGVIGVAGSIGIPTLVLSGVVLSEPFFFVLMMAALLAAERVVDGDGSTGTLVAIGAFAGGTTLVRSHGIALVAAITLVLLLRRRARDGAIAFASAAAVILPWQLWVRAHEGVVPAPMRGHYESYTSWLVRGYQDQGAGLLLRTVRQTSLDLVSTFSTSTAVGMPTVVRMLALVFLAVLMGLGVRALWRSAPTTAVTLTIYTVIVLAWPFAPVRFMWGIWPLVVALPALGAVAAWRWRPGSISLQAGRGLLLAGTMLVAVGYARYNVRGYRGHWWSSIPRGGAARVRDFVVWTRAHTKATDIVASSAEPLVYLYTNRLSVPVTEFRVQDYFGPATAVEHADALRGILAAYPVTVVAIVASDSTSAAARSLTLGDAPALVLRDSFPNGLVFTPVHR